MASITLFLYIFPLLYAAVVLVFTIPLTRKRKTPSFDTAAQKLPGISIVIPFRNEANNLWRLIDSLDAQTYAGDFEIILVNDGSTDRYRDVIAMRSQSQNRPLPPLRVIDAPQSPAGKLSSKQGALDFGIRKAVHDWIALTDADMVLDPAWLEALIKPAVGGAKLVFGHTVILPKYKKTFFTWFQSFQLEILFSFAYALHRCGITGSCMGNNMLFSGKTFFDIGGFESIGYSIVEDRDLLAAFRTKKLSVATTDPFFPTAFTLPCEKVSPYFHQLLRWARGGFRKQSVLSFLGVLLLAQTSLFLVAGTGALPSGVWETVMADQLLTWLFITAAFKRIGSAMNPLFFPFFFVIFLAEAALLPIVLAVKKNIRWKDRKI